MSGGHSERRVVSPILDYEQRQQRESICVAPLTWVLAATTSVIWLASMFTITVGSYGSSDPSALFVPGFALACVALPWWPVNFVLGLMPLVVLYIARKGSDEADKLLRYALISFVGTISFVLVAAVAMRMTDSSSYGGAIPLWLFSYAVACACAWRLARIDPFR